MEPMMRLKWLPAVFLAVVLPAGAVPAAAEDCPVKPFDMDGVIAAVNAASGCGASMKVFEACQMGSTADVQFGAAVEKKCEAAFLSRLKTPQQRAYQEQLGHCEAKYADKQGTMWRAATAMCRAAVSQRYAQRSGK
jgi:hypothetical protein